MKKQKAHRAPKSANDYVRDFTKVVVGALFNYAVVKLRYQKRNTARQGYKTENSAEGTALLNAKEKHTCRKLIFLKSKITKT
jgi:hypothetical protein